MARRRRVGEVVGVGVGEEGDRGGRWHVSTAPRVRRVMARRWLEAGGNRWREAAARGATAGHWLLLWLLAELTYALHAMHCTTTQRPGTRSASGLHVPVTATLSSKLGARSSRRELGGRQHSRQQTAAKSQEPGPIKTKAKKGQGRP
jgi:hypothetical protein